MLNNRLTIITPFLFVLFCIPIYTQYPHIESTILFGHHRSDTDFKENRSHYDFSYDSTSTIPIKAAYTPNVSTYTVEDFKDHFTAYGYTENQILNQHCLYMFNEFVKFAKTYPGYACTIRQMYTTLKNLTRWQAFYFWTNGTYCSGLQERIQFLYNELNSIQPVPRTEPIITRYSSNIQPSEYDTLDSIYSRYTPSLSNAIEKRFEGHDSVKITINRDRQYVTKSYAVNNNSKQLLHSYKYDTNVFDECFGTELNQAIHQESLDILDRIYNLPRNSIIYNHKGALVDFTIAMVEYNHEDITDKAMNIGDLCWILLDYGQAVTEGIALGTYYAAHDILANPIETMVCIVAGKEVLAYQLCKILYNVADIGVTAITNCDDAKEKWNKYTHPLNTIVDAISQKEISLRDAIKGGTSFVVAWKAQGKLLGGLGKFCNTIKQKSIKFVKNNPLLHSQDYLATPEGLLFKATVESNKLKQSGLINTASNLKNNVENSNGAARQIVSASTTARKGIIHNVNKDLRSTIAKYEKHIFSPKHNKNGIQTLGKDQEIIMDSLNDIIMFVDKKGLLKEGPNQIKATINGVNNVEIKCFIQQGEAISVDAYISKFNRIYGNFVDTTKV